MEELIERFKNAFSSLRLTGVKSIERMRFPGRDYDYTKMIGRFESDFSCEVDPKELLLMMRSVSPSGKNGFMKRVRDRYRVNIEGKTRSWLYDFVIIPRTICRMDISDGRLFVYSIGYGREFSYIFQRDRENLNDR